MNGIFQLLRASIAELAESESYFSSGELYTSIFEYGKSKEFFARMDSHCYLYNRGKSGLLEGKRQITSGGI